LPIDLRSLYARLVRTKKPIDAANEARQRLLDFLCSQDLFKATGLDKGLRGGIVIHHVNCNSSQIGTCGESSYLRCNLCRHCGGTSRDAWMIASYPCPVCDRPPLLQRAYPCQPPETNGVSNRQCDTPTWSFAQDQSEESMCRRDCQTLLVVSTACPRCSGPLPAAGKSSVMAR